MIAMIIFMVFPCLLLRAAGGGHPRPFGMSAAHARSRPGGSAAAAIRVNTQHHPCQLSISL
jgi:hypothetical protein